VDQKIFDEGMSIRREVLGAAYARRILKDREAKS
jgi:hypothetical protein